MVDVGSIADARVNTTRGTVVVSEKSCIPYSDAKAWGEETKVLFGPESYHGGDFGLFYHNIHANAKERLTKWSENR